MTTIGENTEGSFSAFMLTTADTAILLESQIVRVIVGTIVEFDWICSISRKYFGTVSGLVVIVVMILSFDAWIVLF